MCIHIGVVKSFFFIREKNKILYKRKKFKDIFRVYIDFFFQFTRHLHFLLFDNLIFFSSKKKVLTYFEKKNNKNLHME
nr:hypothetical protein CparaKRNrm3_p009 [Cryptomonas paramecium]